jgi:hypothetical protein
MRLSQIAGVIRSSCSKQGNGGLRKLVLRGLTLEMSGKAP